jgi:hypothetical protein
MPPRRTQQKPTSGPPRSWRERLQDNFPQKARSRGEAYFRQGRVELDHADHEHVAAYVDGSQEYWVEIDEETAFCECPWFLKGNPCKHLWAAILAADAELQALNPHPETAPPIEPDPDWKDLLFPGQPRRAQGPNRWEGVPGQFMLRYELTVERGRIHAAAYKHKVLKSGKPGKQVAGVTEAILDEPDLPRMDRAILESMRSIADRAAHSYNRWYNPYRRRRFESLPLSSRDINWMLCDLAATGRCTVNLDGKSIAKPLVPGESYSAALEMVLDDESAADKRKPNLVYEPHARLGDRLAPFRDIPIFFGSDPMLFIHEGRLHDIPDANFEWLLRVRKAGNLIKVPKQDAKELVLALDKAEEPPSLEIPEDMAPARVDDAAPDPGLEIEIESDGLSGRVWLDYGGLEIPLDDPRESILNAEDWTRLRRSSEAEAGFLKKLADLDLDVGDGRFSVPAEAGFKALDSLAAEGWRLWGRDRRAVQPGAVSGLRVASGVDWFDLEGDVAFGDAIVPLPRVVRAYLRGETAIDLGDGGAGLLPLEWLKKNAPGLGLGEGGAKSETLRFHSAHALLLDELLEECGEQHMDQDFAKLRSCLREFQGVAAPEPPRSLQGELRGYQREALGWFDFLKSFGFGGVLADDMGLGKTVQALAWLVLEKERNGDGSPSPTLVVAPTSLVPNWMDEAARFAPGLKVLAYTGLDRKQHADALADYDLVLTTYGLLRRDVETLRDVRWSWVILDESQAVKNPDSQTAKAARLLQAERRLCMTGTPLENRLDELWSQMHFLNPGLLGSRAGFDARFAKPVAQGDESVREMLKRCIRPFILRRTKDVVAADLPEKQEFVLRCDMSPDQAKVYARIRDHYRAEIMAAVEESGLERSKIKVLEGLLRLRQAACHPALVGEDKAGSGKLDELARMVAEVAAEGHKCLVFSQFTKFLALIKKRLDKEGVEYFYFDGRTPAKTRRKRVQEFQDNGGPPVFCISLKAGGVGLNLTAADYVFLADPWWNPAVESQAVDRTHRIGQDKKVFAYKLVSAETIDEKVLALQKDKRELAEVLQSGATSTIGSLTREDLEALLS